MTWSEVIRQDVASGELAGVGIALALIVALRRVLEYVQVHATELYAAPAQSDAVEVGSRVR